MSTHDTPGGAPGPRDATEDRKRARDDRRILDLPPLWDPFPGPVADAAPAAPRSPVDEARHAQSLYDAAIEIDDISPRGVAQARENARVAAARLTSAEQRQARDFLDEEFTQGWPEPPRDSRPDLREITPRRYPELRERSGR